MWQPHPLNILFSLLCVWNIESTKKTPTSTPELQTAHVQKVGQHCASVVVDPICNDGTTDVEFLALWVREVRGARQPMVCEMLLLQSQPHPNDISTSHCSHGRHERLCPKAHYLELSASSRTDCRVLSEDSFATDFHRGHSCTRWFGGNGVAELALQMASECALSPPVLLPRRLGSSGYFFV